MELGYCCYYYCYRPLPRTGLAGAEVEVSVVVVVTVQLQWVMKWELSEGWRKWRCCSVWTPPPDLVLETAAKCCWEVGLADLAYWDRMVSR